MVGEADLGETRSVGKHSLGLAAPPVLGVPAVDAGHGEASCRQGRSHGPLCSPDVTLQLLQAAEVACADVRAVPALCQPEPGAGVAWEFRGEERLGCGSSLTVARAVCASGGASPRSQHDQLLSETGPLEPDIQPRLRRQQ